MDQSILEIAGSVSGVTIALTIAGIGFTLPNLANSVSIYYKTHCLFSASKHEADWSDCKLTKIDRIRQYVQLESLSLKNNLLTSLTDLHYVQKLRMLDVSNNRLESLEGLSSCTNLVWLNCKSNRLNTLEGLASCPQLMFLNCSNNTITTLNALSHHIGLTELNCNNNLLVTLEGIGGHGSLISLACNNNILILIDDITRCTLLETLDCSNNVIDSLEPIAAMPRLREIQYGDNPLGIQTTAVEHILDRLGQPHHRRAEHDYIWRERTVYADRQNVHNTHIQKSVCHSLQSLLQDPEPKFSIKLIKSSNLDGAVKEALISYCRDRTEHSTYNITYSQLLAHIWARIHKSEHTTELLKILSEQVRDSKDKCFTGRFNRLLSVLVGFYDDITIEISDTARISAIILTIRKQVKPYSAVTHRRIAEEQLLAAGYTETAIEPWLGAITEL